MNIANLYRKIKQILNDSNAALANKGLNMVTSLNEIPNEILKLGSINQLPYLLRKEIIEVTENDLVGVTKIGQGVFLQCDNLTSVIIPNSVTSIDEQAFRLCNNLANITIPEGVESIGVSAFESCKGLIEVDIPISAITIGAYAFASCDNLTNIYLKPSTPPTLGNTYAIPSHTTIHVPVGRGDVYKSATNWSVFSDRIVEDIVLE